MKVVFFVLNDANKLNQLLNELNNLNIHGGTIFDTSGMGRELSKSEDFPLFGTLRYLLNPGLKTTKTLLFVIEEKKIPTLIEGIENVVGNLEGPGTGILFSFPLDYVKGIKL